MRTMLIALAVLSAGCTTVKPTYLPDGRQGHAVSCPGTARNWGHCHEKAGEVCGARGYDVLSQDGHGSFIHNTMGGNFQVIPTASRTLLIACR